VILGDNFIRHSSSEHRDRANFEVKRQARRRSFDQWRYPALHRRNLALQGHHLAVKMETVVGARKI